MEKEQTQRKMVLLLNHSTWETEAGRLSLRTYNKTVSKKVARDGSAAKSTGFQKTWV